MALAVDAPAADRAIVNTRVLGAPRERVFDAFTDPDRISRWWGPNGFTNTFEEFDPRPGGAWTFVMHGPDGAAYPNRSVFVEVAWPERIALRHLSGHEYDLTATFAEEGGKTRLTWRMLFASAEEHERMRAFVTDANEQNFDRLEAELSRSA